MHEDAGEIQLHLKSDIHIRTIDGGTPPQGETTIRNLIQTAALSVRQLLELHAVLEARGTLPENTFRPRNINLKAKGRVQKEARKAKGSLRGNCAYACYIYN